MASSSSGTARILYLQPKGEPNATCSMPKDPAQIRRADRPRRRPEQARATARAILRRHRGQGTRGRCRHQDLKVHGPLWIRRQGRHAGRPRARCRRPTSFSPSAANRRRAWCSTPTTAESRHAASGRGTTAGCGFNKHTMEGGGAAFFQLQRRRPPSPHQAKNSRPISRLAERDDQSRAKTSTLDTQDRTHL